MAEADRPGFRATSAAPGGFDILVLDARSKQSLASVRSLGRAGLRVASGESANACGPSGGALAFRSRYSACNVILPAIVDDGAEFGAAVVQFVHRHPTRVVLPTCDEALMSLMKQRKQLAELGCVLALAPDPVLEITTDKDRTLVVAHGLGIEYPETMRVGSVADLTAAQAGFGFPFVLKSAFSWTGQSADRLLPKEVVDAAEARAVTEEFLAAGSGVLAQQWACGRREGVTLFVVDGEILASCAHVAYRTSPALGGVSVMRESIPVPPDIYSAAVCLVTTIGLQGVCEVEFRRDARGRPLLMEINARLAGTIENAMRSGIDLPMMVWQWASGLPVDRAGGYRTGVRTRWLQGDLRWLVNNQRRAGRPDSVPRHQALWAFTSEFFRTRHYDCLDRRDLGPALAELRITAAAARRSRNPGQHQMASAGKENRMSASEVLIIGAGPFGLSISAHLRALGVEHRIVGRPMDTWRAHMPVGMNLKSEPYASSMSSPHRGYDLATYCGQHGLEYIERGGPLPLGRFLAFADWYAERLVPDIIDVGVTEVAAADGGFRVSFSEGEPLTVRQVVVATGVLPYANIPAELSGLPADLISHTSDHRILEPFRGRRVAVVGAGQSALETAALLHEKGADVQVIARRPALSWPDPNPDRVSLLGHIRRPVTNLCEGWRCAFWNSPAAFRTLPQDMRIVKARTVLGPAGSWWLKDRVEGALDVHAGHRVKEARAEGTGVRLLLDGPKLSALDVDHVIAGTGFRIDTARLPFLPAKVRARIATINGYPAVNRAGESTVPGLYFAGAPTAVSLGPSARFIAGTHNVADRLARSVARRSGRGRSSAQTAGASGQAARTKEDVTFQKAV